MRYKFLVAQAIGGIMEKPEFTYENPQIIVAHDEAEARMIYNSKYSCYYFYGTVLSNEGRTLQQITNKTPVNEKREKEKQEWLQK